MITNPPPTNAQLLARLHKLPAPQRQYLLRQVGIPKTTCNLGTGAALEVLYKLGRWINKQDA